MAGLVIACSRLLVAGDKQKKEGQVRDKTRED